LIEPHIQTTKDLKDKIGKFLQRIESESTDSTAVDTNVSLSREGFNSVRDHIWKIETNRVLPNLGTISIPVASEGGKGIVKKTVEVIEEIRKIQAEQAANPLSPTVDEMRQFRAMQCSNESEPMLSPQ
jgi:hypothetical protein